MAATADINQTRTIDDMQIPSLALHQLKAKRKQTLAVTVQVSWRMAFRFGSGDAEVVDNEDYH